MSLHLVPIAAPTQTTSVESPPTSQATQYLTSEGLLLYCQTQLGSIDGEIKSMMKEQMKNLDRKKALSTVETAMKEHQPPKTDADVAAINDAFDKAIASLPPGDPTRLALEEKKASVSAALEGSKVLRAGVPGGEGWFKTGLVIGMSKENWEGQIGGISSLKDEVSGNAELTMIRLQSLISQRQTAVQLTTNMTAKLEQTAAMVAKNV
jgi:hypothetical protein